MDVMANASSYFVGLDIGGTTVKAVLVNHLAEQVGPLTQVISSVVVGDPARPDFTAERAEIRIAPTLGLPTIGSVRLVRPRLYGTYRGGKLSFGSLDKLLFAPGPRRAAWYPWYCDDFCHNIPCNKY